MARKKTAKADAPYPPGWEPFLAAINANLDDDTVRLVFADWLQENGDEARAEFIRLQCAQSAGALSDEHQAIERMNELLVLNRERWVSQLPKWVLRDHHWPGLQYYGFRRGFLDRFAATPTRWLQHGKRIRRETPVTELRLWGWGSEIFSSPLVWGLKALSLPTGSRSGDSMSSGDALLLSDSRIVDSLVSLRLPVLNLDAVAISALFGTSPLTCLRELYVDAYSGDWRKSPGNDVALALATNSNITNLEKLTFFFTNLEASAFESLLASGVVNRLRHLSLINNRLRDEGVRALVASRLVSLEELDLQDNGLTHDAVRLLSEWPGLRTIRRLRLGPSNTPDADADSIRNSPHAVALKDLDVTPRQP